MKRSYRVVLIECGNFFRRLRGALGARLLIGLSAAIAALLFLGWLAEEVFEGAANNFDEQTRAVVHSFAAPPLTGLMLMASFLGSTVFLIALFIFVAIIFISTNRRRGLLLFAATIAGAIILNFALKTAFHRPRPEPFFNTPLPSSYSFPSGHALFAVCFYGVLAWLMTDRGKNRFFSAAIWTTAILLILLIGVSRVYLGVHYPSDVLAGYAAAFVWVFTVALSDYLWRRNSRKKN